MNIRPPCAKGAPPQAVGDWLWNDVPRVRRIALILRFAQDDTLISYIVILSRQAKNLQHGIKILRFAQDDTLISYIVILSRQAKNL